LTAAPVFLAPSSDLAADVIELSGAEGRHAATVRRLRSGERADVTDGAGRLASCVVAEVCGGTVRLAVQSRITVPAASPALSVVQALPKGDRGELAVETMTEAGVDTIVPWAADRSVARWRDDRVARGVERWRVAAREAAKQARRAWLPEVAGLAARGDVVARIAGADLAIVLEADADRKLSSLEFPAAGSIVLIVGPEGGITPHERAAFAAAGAQEARLGDTVLRTSTAGVAAAAVVFARTARW
jgi:16S rRNA (uracil1498-N3)-methyltransferase